MLSHVLTQVCFGEIARRADDEIDLALAALLIAEEEYPRLRPSDVLESIGELARRAPRLEGSGRERAATLAHHLFVTEGFRPNQEAYYDPGNSYLNCVLERRLGIPISLSIVLIEVAARLGLTLVGVGFPRRFLVRLPDDDDFFIDPFERGRTRTAEGCRRLFRQLGGEDESWSPDFLAPATRKHVLQRMLRNLKEIFLRANDVPRCLAAAEKLSALEPGDLDEIRDRGVLSLHGGAWVRALADLETYLAGRPAADDSELIRRHCRVLRRHIVEAGH
jgi:regulator of sirC expression with transglutaminase-like and TPR domain